MVLWRPTVHTESASRTWQLAWRGFTPPFLGVVMNAVEPDDANETMEDLTDEQLEWVAGGSTGKNTGAGAGTNRCNCNNDVNGGGSGA